MKTEPHIEGKLYRIEREGIRLYSATLKDGVYWHTGGSNRIEVPVGTIVMKLPGQHEYAGNWIVVLYREQVCFMESRHLDTEEVK